jgi:methylenetetrahydrofolate reductase (NADPH)
MEDLHLSFEFFPTKTDAGTEKLFKSQQQLSELGPDLFSMTYGLADRLVRIRKTWVRRFHQQGVPIAPHISCIGHTKAEINEIIGEYREQGIESLVVLRGDLPSGLGFQQGDFRYARDLVEYIRTISQDHFELYIAAYPEVHPQARGYNQDLEAFIDKVNAGADAAITQFFFNPDSYFYFVDQLAQKSVDIPVLPGIMPIANFSKLARFSDACGAEIPRWVRRRLEAYGDDSASIRAFGIDVVTQLCDDLLSNDAPGLHFYTLNNADLSIEILNNLGC